MPWNPYRDRAEEAALDTEMLAREAHKPLLDHHSLDAPGARADMARFITRSSTSTTPPSFTCPVCTGTSYHPDDIAEGYCGACHDWTGA